MIYTSGRYGSTIDNSTYSYNCSYPPSISYKGVDITYDELDELIAKKQGFKLMPAPPKPKERIVFDGDYTIYYDKNGNKTIVSKMPEDEYDAEKAVLWALLKSKGIKPKKVQELLANSIDRDVKRKERAAKKELAKQAAKKPVEIEVTQTKKGVRIDLSKITRHNTTSLEEIFKEVLAETLTKYSK